MKEKQENSVLPQIAGRYAGISGRTEERLQKSENPPGNAGAYWLIQ